MLPRRRNNFFCIIAIVLVVAVYAGMAAYFQNQMSSSKRSRAQQQMEDRRAKDGKVDPGFLQQLLDRQQRMRNNGGENIPFPLASSDKKGGDNNNNNRNNQNNNQNNNLDNNFNNNNFNNNNFNNNNNNNQPTLPPAPPPPPPPPPPTQPSCGREVQAFYYAWYETPSFDGDWRHWRHEVLDGSKVVIQPPNDIGSHFWPQAGLYSSNDPSIIALHMQQMKSHGITTIIHSWYPKSKCDQQGGCADKITKVLMDEAAKEGLTVNFHIEPYIDRRPQSVRDDIAYILDNYGSHPAFYRDSDNLPWFYVYDSYLSPAQEWQQLLSPQGTISIRNSRLDAKMIGLIVNEQEKNDLVTANFDGFYTYFAADGFTLGSTMANWKNLASFAASHHKFIVISVGPGYIDEKIRPFNTRNTRDRENGGYFKRAFSTAVDAMKAAFGTDVGLGGRGNFGGVIAITSWNEWHEGTQIEPAVPHNGFKDYSPHSPTYYIDLLADMVSEQWSCQ